MENEYIAEKFFDKEDFTESPLTGREYEKCIFINCKFQKSDLSEKYFSACEFRGCDMSMAIIKKATLKDVMFRDCKLLGLQFNTCSEFLFAVAFEKCVLNFSTFYKVKLRKSKFLYCSMQDVDLTEADLGGVVLDHCDLANATFEHTMLEKADLRTAFNYSLDPEMNRIKKAKFSLGGVGGLLGKYGVEIE